MSKRRILIVDDSGERHFQAADLEFGFLVMGIDLEVCVVKTATEAMDKLHEWYKSGHKADLILHDVTMPADNEQQYLQENVLRSVDSRTVSQYLAPLRGTRLQMGPGFLGMLLDFCKKELGPDFMPEDFFIISADCDEKHIIEGYNDTYRETKAIDRDELNDLCVRKYGEYEAFTLVNAQTAELAMYCNEKWGTDFPTNDMTCYENGALAEQIMKLREMLEVRSDSLPTVSQLKQETVRYGVLDLDKAATAINGGILSEADISGLHITIPPHGKLQYQNIEDHPENPALIYGENGVLGTISGRLALCEEDILWLAENHPNDPIILVCERAEHIDHLLPMIHGLIVLKNDHKAMHLKQTAENHGLPFITGVMGGMNENDDLYYPCIRDGKLIECLSGRFFEKNAQEWVTLHASDRLPEASRDETDTPKTQYNLYAERLEIVDHPFPKEKLENLMGIFDLARIREEMKVEANADTAEQSQIAIDLGAEGIGLNRSENWALGPEAQDRMLKFLLSEDDSYRTNNIAWLYKHYFSHFQRNLAVLEQVSNPSFLVNFRAPDLVPHEIMTPAQRTAFFARIGEQNSRGVQAALRTKGLYETWMQAGFEAIDASNFPFHRVRFCAPMVSTLEDMVSFNQMKADAAGGKRIASRAMNERPEFLGVAEELATHMEGGWCGGGNHLTREMLWRDLGRDVRRNDTPVIEQWMIANGFSGLSPFDSFCEPVQSHFATTQAIARATNPKMDTSLCSNQVGYDIPSIRFAVTHGFNSISVPPRYLNFAKLASGAMVNEGLTGSALAPGY